MEPFSRTLSSEGCCLGYFIVNICYCTCYCNIFKIFKLIYENKLWFGGGNHLHCSHHRPLHCPTCKQKTITDCWLKEKGERATYPGLVHLSASCCSEDHFEGLDELLKRYDEFNILTILQSKSIVLQFTTVDKTTSGMSTNTVIHLQCSCLSVCCSTEAVECDNGVCILCRQTPLSH